MSEIIRVEQWSSRYGYCQIKIPTQRDVEEFARKHLAELERLGKVNLYNNEKTYCQVLGRWVSRRYYLENYEQVQYLMNNSEINYWISPQELQRANN